MYIIKPGIPITKKDKHMKLKEFICDICKCEWIANENEYKEDWTKHSIPCYCNCPNCGTEIFALEDIKGSAVHSHVRCK